MVGIEITHIVREIITDSASAIEVKQVGRRCQPARAYKAPKGSHRVRFAFAPSNAMAQRP